MELEPKTTLQLLQQEKIECIELIRSFLIEREIRLLIGETDDINDLNTEMSALTKRQVAINKLIQREQLRLDNIVLEDFPAFLMISSVSLESI